MRVMRRSLGRKSFILMLATLLLLAGAAGAQQPATTAVPSSREAVRQSFAPIVKRTAPAVVNVFSRRVVENHSPFQNDPFFRRFFGDAFRLALPRERVLNSLGSGVILDASGLIVTNYHVINGAQEITVVLNDRREFSATVLLSDEQLDLAALKIDVGKERLPVLEIADSDALQVGDLVLAIGNPFGVGQTVTTGIVSALARTGIGLGTFGSYIQTDAAINPGNSGGALVDLDGHLVGINTAIYSESGGSVGIGFAIPTGLVRAVLAAVAKGQHLVARPWLGVNGEGVTAEAARKLGLPHPIGLQITDVAAGSPAGGAGLIAGDVILAIDGHDIDDTDGMRFRLATLGIGTPAELTVWHGGTTRTVKVTLAAAPDQPARDVSELPPGNPLAGVSAGNLNPAFAEEVNLPQNARGVIVVAVTSGSPAARLGVQNGDLIIEINSRKIANVAQLKSLLTQSKSPWTIVLRRGNRTFTAVVR